MPQEGWYDDPHDPQNYRWWDGSQWTEHTRAIDVADAQAVGAPMPVTAAAGASTGGGVWSARPQAVEGQRTADAAPGAVASPPVSTPTSDVRFRMFPRIAALLGCLITFGAGLYMATLTSVAGNTVAEAFYNALGWAIIGAVLCFGASFSLREYDQMRAEQHDQR